MGVFSSGGVGIDLGSANVTIFLENEGVVLGFLDRNKHFTLEGFQVPGPFADTGRGMLTCWPHRHGTDGFFFARLRRNQDGDL